MCQASTELAGLEAVVTNSVPRDEWATRIPASIGNIRVLQTRIMYHKSVRDVNWCWMEQKLAASKCVAVGECGLNETAGDMDLHEKVFKWQIFLAHQLKKPLVPHLRGKTPRATSAFYGWALALTMPVLHKCPKIYLHRFGAGKASEFQLWHLSFPDFLVGCSWLTTSELSRENMLRSMLATVIALKTDSPHLASRIGIVNSSYRIYQQAVTVWEIRNLPTSTVIEGLNLSLHQSYPLGPCDQFFNVSPRITSKWGEHGKSAHLAHIRYINPDFKGIVQTVNSLTSGESSDVGPTLSMTGKVWDKLDCFKRKWSIVWYRI